MSVLVTTPPPNRQRPSNYSAFQEIVHRSISQCAFWFTCLPVDLDGVEDFGSYICEVIDGTHEAIELCFDGLYFPQILGCAVQIPPVCLY
jgi:hypothetical protein